MHFESNEVKDGWFLLMKTNEWMNAVEWSTTCSFLNDDFNEIENSNKTHPYNMFPSSYSFLLLKSIIIIIMIIIIYINWK